MCSIWKSCSADVLVYVPHRYRYQSNAPNKMLRSFWMLLQQAVSMFYLWFIFAVMEQGSFIQSLQDGRCSPEGYRIRESSKSPESMGWNVKADLRAFCAVSKTPSGFYLLSYWEFSWSVEIKVWCIVKTYCLPWRTFSLAQNISQFIQKSLDFHLRNQQKAVNSINMMALKMFFGKWSKLLLNSVISWPQRKKVTFLYGPSEYFSINTVEFGWYDWFVNIMTNGEKTRTRKTERKNRISKNPALYMISLSLRFSMGVAEHHIQFWTHS